jgi:hypothetical protein
MHCLCDIQESLKRDENRPHASRCALLKHVDYEDHTMSVREGSESSHHPQSDMRWQSCNKLALHKDKNDKSLMADEESRSRSKSNHHHHHAAVPSDTRSNHGIPSHLDNSDGTETDLVDRSQGHSYPPSEIHCDSVHHDDATSPKCVEEDTEAVTDADTGGTMCENRLSKPSGSEARLLPQCHGHGTQTISSLGALSLPPNSSKTRDENQTMAQTSSSPFIIQETVVPVNSYKSSHENHTAAQSIREAEGTPNLTCSEGRSNFKQCVRSEENHCKVSLDGMPRRRMSEGNEQAAGLSMATLRSTCVRDRGREDDGKNTSITTRRSCTLQSTIEQDQVSLDPRETLKMAVMPPEIQVVTSTEQQAVLGTQTEAPVLETQTEAPVLETQTEAPIESTSEYHHLLREPTTLLYCAVHEFFKITPTIWYARPAVHGSILVTCQCAAMIWTLNSTGIMCQCAAMIWTLNSIMCRCIRNLNSK